MTADEARLKRQEIPFCPRGRQHVAGIDIERLEDQRQFVHERDIEIALGIFDDLGRLGDLDRGRAVNAGRHDRSVNVGNDIERFRILRRDHLHDRLKTMLLVAGIDALRRIPDVEIRRRPSSPNIARGSARILLRPRPG